MALSTPMGTRGGYFGKSVSVLLLEGLALARNSPDSKRQWNQGYMGLYRMGLAPVQEQEARVRHLKDGKVEWQGQRQDQEFQAGKYAVN
jgi:hypothetical protein